MHISGLLVTAVCAILPSVQAHGHMKGFNIAANTPNGGCKSTKDWEAAFRTMKHLPGNFNHVRLYASSDCHTLERAVPAAKKVGIKLLAGVWTEDEQHFEREKHALADAIKHHGIGWLSAVSAGSEDLYRGDTDPATLSRQIKEVRNIVKSHKGGKDIKVGHVDTWTAWVNEANAEVIKASGFIGMDGYPYYQGSHIKDSKHVFYKSLAKTEAAVRRHHKGAPVWVTETGWPVTGPSDGNAIASKKNAQHYWKDTMCSIFKKHSVFVFTLHDPGSSPSFGVVGKGGKTRYNLHC